eukprot:scaffold4927_cov139-Amphora_coffeaeformis.AAC.11
MSRSYVHPVPQSSKDAHIDLSKRSSRARRRQEEGRKQIRRKIEVEELEIRDVVPTHLFILLLRFRLRLCRLDCFTQVDD